MGSAHTDPLDALLRESKGPKESGIKIALSRVAAETKPWPQSAAAGPFIFSTAPFVRCLKLARQPTQKCAPAARVEDRLPLG